MESRTSDGPIRKVGHSVKDKLSLKITSQGHVQQFQCSEGTAGGGGKCSYLCIQSGWSYNQSKIPSLSLNLKKKALGNNETVLYVQMLSFGTCNILRKKSACILGESRGAYRNKTDHRLVNTKVIGEKVVRYTVLSNCLNSKIFQNKKIKKNVYRKFKGALGTELEFTRSKTISSWYLGLWIVRIYVYPVEVWKSTLKVNNKG